MAGCCSCAPVEWKVRLGAAYFTFSHRFYHSFSTLITKALYRSPHRCADGPASASQANHWGDCDAVSTIITKAWLQQIPYHENASIIHDFRSLTSSNDAPTSRVLPLVSRTPYEYGYMDARAAQSDYYYFSPLSSSRLQITSTPANARGLLARPEEVCMGLKTECELHRTNLSVTDTDELYTETCLSDLRSFFRFTELILDSGACLLLAALNI